MQSVVRSVKPGSSLSRAIHRQNNASVLLQPTRMNTAFQQRFTITTGSAVCSNTSVPTCSNSGSTTSSLGTGRAHWAHRSYSTQQTFEGASGSSSSVTVQELEQLLAIGDFAGFQQACVAVTATIGSNKTAATKELFHFLLKTLAEQPKAFAPLASTASIPTKQDDTFDPLNSAIGILTDMGREANMGRAALQPDRSTILLLLKVATTSQEYTSLSAARAHWQSVYALVDVIRHGRLPAVMSLEQWELPDLNNVELDQALWKAMFECIQSASSAVIRENNTSRPVQFLNELNTMKFLMADQLIRLDNVVMDDGLWGFVVQALGDSESRERLENILPKLHAMDPTSAELYSNIAEALAKCGSIGRATDIMHTLSHTRDTLPSIGPFVALARHHAKTGNYEAIRHDFKVWVDKGQASDINQIRLKDIHRSMMSACAITLDRIVNMVSTTTRHRQMNTLPKDVLPAITTPPQLSWLQFNEVKYIWRQSQEAMEGIPKDEWTVEDYDTAVRITTRLNLLQPHEWGLHDYARKLFIEMKKDYKLRPLKATYITMMETTARTREYGVSRESGDTFRRVMRIFEEMTSWGGYSVQSPQDFGPLIEACFGMTSHSPFVASQWIHSNQLYTHLEKQLKFVEAKMRDILESNGVNQRSGDNNNFRSGNGFARYHDSTTMANVLAGLARADKVDEVLKRWEELPLQGIERDTKLYQTIIGASQGQDKLARYVLRTVRYQMLKEQPVVDLTPEVFTGLLNCCIRAQDPISARSLISQCSTSGKIQKTAEWYIPMVRACLMLEGMEEEGGFLLDEMRKHEMKMGGFSGSFYEFLMDYFVMKRQDYQAGREVFKDFVRSEQSRINEILTAHDSGISNGRLQAIGDEEDMNLLSTTLSDWLLTRQAQKLQMPVKHLVERVEISQRSASMLNLLVLSHIRERTQLLEHEKRSGFVSGAKDRLKDAQLVMHYLVDGGRQYSISEEKKHVDLDGSTIPGDGFLVEATPTQRDSSQWSGSSSEISLDSSLLFHSPTERLAYGDRNSHGDDESMTPGRLVFVNKYVLGEYIDTCIREGSPEMLAEADWALNTVMPRVIGRARMVRDGQRLRQALESAQQRHEQQQRLQQLGLQQ
ncbi:hypothetical protein BX616_000966 [Lobosporangium transversale]|uniref:Pentacotripeptide-repeat region of PRORP domain-containing protein n=1 Tax=Lobosporangium transversale TaxID=64571 RepID=A0A1Y2H7R7_9FUNG|nr:hypothetical protein BCR41DRAFT_344517 [Lobosporangium transversale]KAF9905633.1 hypothetical protein BX616_000966 [Lobosporangium transversale]ORZ29082.1 hypothetical protein BCR41DRAFT_344517 [Lobosporangium transversale]|eukprot:XP_021886755.1 hypothetical protein BCR41DRAFT_344517 [Lobosporangium transversale]